MTSKRGQEYCLIVEGSYYSESEAQRALQDPFIEDWVERTGHFRIHNLDEIEVAKDVTLGSLQIFMIDEEVFEIISNDASLPLTEKKARMVKEALQRQAIFDEIKVVPLEEDDVI